jgi:hypothetical protein
MNLKIFSVCHKCGLVRNIKLAGLSQCTCMGQSTFEYELILRDEEESRSIAHERYLTLVELYTRQGRNDNAFTELRRRYNE